MTIEDVENRAKLSVYKLLRSEQDTTIHPADRYFAELITTRTMQRATFLQLAKRLIQIYGIYLRTELGEDPPLLKELDQACIDLLPPMDHENPNDTEIPAYDPAQPDERGYHIYIGNERIMVEHPFDRKIHTNVISPLKDIVPDWAFNRFHRKEWSYPTHAIEVVSTALAPYPYTYSIKALQLLAYVKQETLISQEVDMYLNYWKDFELQEAQKKLPGLLDAPLSDGRKLYAHQREAVERLVTQGRLILAHDMGLGKTISALLAAKAYQRTVFVIAPLSTHGSWAREAAAVGVAIEIYSWGKLPAPPEKPFTLVGDEAHMIQSLSSQRSKAFLALAERAGAVFCATGTPMKNAQASNLFPLLVACKHPLGEDKQKFDNRYTTGYTKRIGRRNVFESTGAAHLDELHERTRDVVLYKRKNECLDLPPKTRVRRPIEAGGQIEELYQDTVTRLWEEHRARMQARKDEAAAMLEAAREQGADIDPELLEAAEKDSSFARALVEMEILRHAASIAKVDAAISIAEEIQEQGGSIVIFSVYRDVARQVATLLKCDCLMGDVPVKERQKIIDRFQERETTALVCTAAGGVGITLTAAQTVVLIERPWTPGDVIQSEDRIYRIGQVAPVTSYWLQYEAMDDRVDHLLEQKQKIIDHVLTGIPGQANAGMNMSILSTAREILKSIHENIPIDSLISQKEQELMARAEAIAAAKAAKDQPPQFVKKRVKREKAGRPRLGGDHAERRRGFEITLDVQTLEDLTSRTKNRSAYIERLVIESLSADNPEQLQQIESKLAERCRHLPTRIVEAIRHIKETRGAHAALEASEVAALALDPERTAIP